MQSIVKNESMSNILPTTPDQNIKDLKNTINWFSNKWNQFINTKYGKKIDEFFNGKSEQWYAERGMQKPIGGLGIASLVVPKLPIKYRIYATNNGNWNTKWIDEDLISGEKLLKDFLTSDVRNQTFARNNAEFKALTGKNLPRNDSFINQPLIYKFSSNLGNTVAGQYSNLDDFITINSRVPANYDRTLFHEGLHRNRFGEALDPKFFANFTSEEQRLAQQFYNQKTFPLINFQNPEKARYFMTPGELSTNMLEVGAYNGIKFGETYPGAEEAIKRISEIEKIDPWSKDVLPYINYKKYPEAAWKALTGTLLGTAPFVVNNPSKEPENANPVE